MKEKISRVAFVVNVRNLRNMERFVGALRFGRDHPDIIFEIFSLHDLGTDEMLRTFKAQHYDGLINCDIPSERIARIMSCIRRGSPVVEYNRAPGGGRQRAQINVDSGTIGSAAIGHLYGRGIRHFAYVGVHHTSEREIMTAYDSLLEAETRKLGCDYRRYIPKPYSCYFINGSEYESFSEWLQTLPKPCGVITHNIWGAKYVVETAKRNGIDIPEKLMIVATDDSPEITESISPSISAVKLEQDNSGFMAAQCIHGMINSSESGSRIRTYGISKVIERESTTPSTGSARIISLAKQYIREHAKDGISVGDVAKHLSIARRTLTLRFSEIGETVHSDINAVRLEEALRLHRSTSKPLTDIAYGAGFASPDTMRRLFKRKFGVPITKYH